MILIQFFFFEFPLLADFNMHLSLWCLQRNGYDFWNCTSMGCWNRWPTWKHTPLFSKIWTGLVLAIGKNCVWAFVISPLSIHRGKKMYDPIFRLTFSFWISSNAVKDKIKKELIDIEYREEANISRAVLTIHWSSHYLFLSIVHLMCC